MFLFKRNENAEMPPPLPPRRNHIYTSLNSQTDANTKTRKSTWNLKNVFGRAKVSADSHSTKCLKATSDKISSKSSFTKRQTSGIISKLYTDDFQSNSLGNCKNSFSTPDLTNIIETANAKPTKKVEIDETDLDIMDIERSNSLNCSTNQFNRIAPLNVSANIQWSHNLSLTLSSACDSSAINLVGANVNNFDSFHGPDLSGYLKMAPILKKDNKLLQRTSTMQNIETKDLLNSSSIYCAMAPILHKNDESDENDLKSADEITKNITFERTFEFDEELPHLDCSMKSIGEKNTNYDESCSSGISSDEGIASSNSNTIKSNSITDASLNSQSDRNDDAISMTYTESPPQSAQPMLLNTNPFEYYSTKFDEKTPSYFPNRNAMPDITKYTVNNSNLKSQSTHIQSAKKANYKAVMKTPNSGKVHKFKQRRSSINDNSNYIEYHPTACSNENWCSIYNKNQNIKALPQQNTHNYENKVLSHLDTNTKLDSQRQTMKIAKHNFEKNSKITKVTSSPRRIYNKCATLAIRLKTSPSSPNGATPIECEYANSSISDHTPSNKSFTFDSSMSSSSRVENDYRMSSSADSSSSGFIRSWARLRRLDFSPLKTKINNILQRTHSEF